ncbi:MAG: mechanosensitive ion channel family protein [Planctomycetota bacterium]
MFGKVEDITIRNTMLRKTDGELVVVPNAHLFKSNVEILTNRPKRRVRITCGVGYGENVDRSREVIRDAVASCTTVSAPKSVEVFADEFADSSVNFEVAWWTGATPLEIRKSRDEVIAAIKAALDQEEIEIPFPYRTLTFSETLKMKGVLEQSKNSSGAPETANGYAD